MSTTLPRRALGAQRAEDPRLQEDRDLYRYGKMRWTRSDIGLVLAAVLAACLAVLGMWLR